MLYSSEETKSIVKKDVAFLPAGITDNVSFAGIRYEKTPNNSFVELKFEKDGKTMTHTEWAPQQGNSTPEAYKNKCRNQLSRFQQIVAAFYPYEQYPDMYKVNPDTNEPYIVFEGATFDDLANWVVDKMNNADKSTKVRLKIVYNDRGYTTLPMYAVYTFIEPMSIVDAGNSMITKLGIDNFDKPIKADREVKVGNPLEDTAVAANDLPF